VKKNNINRATQKLGIHFKNQNKKQNDKRILTKKKNKNATAQKF